MKHKHEIIETAIGGGAIGGVLGALLTGKKEGAMISALVGAAIGASIEARKESKKLTTPILFEEGGKLYREYANGKIEFVKEIPMSSIKIPSTFTFE